jgi:hypothetical protein
MSDQYMTEDEAIVLDALMPGNQNVGVGHKLKQALAGQVFMGTKFYLDPTNGNDLNDGLSVTSAKKTLTAAYALLTANKNDCLFFIGGASSVVLTAAFTWDKSYTHFVGLGVETRFGGRCRIGHAGTAIGTMFTVSGSGCIFSNIHFQHGQASATNLIAVSVSGLRNLFNNCHFEASLDTVASGGSYAWRCVQLESAAQANTFKKCTFGTWTVAWASTDGKVLNFVGDNADTFVEDCVFIMNHTSTSFVPVGFDGPITGANSYVSFNGCQFIATNAKPAVIFAVPTNGWIMLNKCNAFNVTAWSTTNAKLIEANGAANASGTGLGVAQA